MTVALFAFGGLLAGLGTRAAALAFVAAAVFGARQPQPLLAAVCTWTAAMAATWVLIDRRSPRALAVPCLGAAAVLAAAGSPNGAVVLMLWVLGTVAAILHRGDAPSAGRWALAVAASDVVFAVAIATAAGRGFEGWPATLELPGAIAMLLAAVLRTPLGAGPSRVDGTAVSASTRLASLLIVRAQTVVLIGLAIAAVGDRTIVRAIVVLGACAFAAAVLAGTRATLDSVQEVGLVAMAVGGSALGWVPAGWVWGALAAGTLTHHLRSTTGAGEAGPFADAVARGAHVGLPYVPVAAAVLEGAFASSSRLAVTVLLSVLLGLAGRAWTTAAPDRPEDTGSGRLAWAVLAAAFAATLAAPLLSLPRPPGGGAAPWLGWGAALVVLGAVAGSQMRDVVAPRIDGDRDRRTAALRRAFADRMSVADVVATDVVLWATLTAVAAAGVVLWVIGLGRGFL